MKTTLRLLSIFLLITFRGISQQSQNNDGNVYKTYNPNEISSSFQAYYFWKKQHFICANFDQQYTSQKSLDGFLDKTFLDRLFRMQYAIYGNYCLDGKHWNISFNEILSQKTQGENGFTSRLLLTHLGNIRGIDLTKQISTAYINNPDATGPYYSYQTESPCYEVAGMIGIAKRFTIKDKERLRISFNYNISFRGPLKKETYDYYNDRLIDLSSFQFDISWRLTDLLNVNLFAARNTRYTISSNQNTNGNYNVITPTYGIALKFFIIQEKMQKLNYIF